MFRHTTLQNTSIQRIIVALLAVMVVLVPGNGSLAAQCWRPPVAGVVTDPFRPPSCPYCAGNRGLEYRVATTAQVRTVAAGVVTWAGSIAGTRYVVVRHVDGWRTTYGRLTSSTVRTGDRLASQSRVGTASSSFYFGLRVGEQYRDPAPHLGRLVGRPRLVPTDGSAARRPPPPSWRCSPATS